MINSCLFGYYPKISAPSTLLRNKKKLEYVHLYFFYLSRIFPSIWRTKWKLKIYIINLKRKCYILFDKLVPNSYSNIPTICKTFNISGLKNIFIHLIFCLNNKILNLFPPLLLTGIAYVSEGTGCKCAVIFSDCFMVTSYHSPLL